MSVTFPRGFRAHGITAGLKPSGRPDLALLVADEPAAVAALLTTNAYPAAPVKLTRERVQDGYSQAVLVNSGDANAGRGDPGDFDALVTTATVAHVMGIDPDAVLACSTGVIGGDFPAAIIQDATEGLVEGLTDDGGARFAEAICTTDTVVKVAQAEVGPYRIGACAKGAAMVQPHLELATMLVFFTTDAPLGVPATRLLAKTALQPGFEQLTIDGCTSTNDTVLLMASGAAGGPAVKTDTTEWMELEAALRTLADDLAYQMAADAEGGTKVLLVDVVNAHRADEAAVIAKAVANSVLVKTAIFGGDPNPGRIVQAVGSSGASFDPEMTTIWLGDVLVADAARIPTGVKDSPEAVKAVAGTEVKIKIDLHAGTSMARAIGCDLSYEYVKINAEYTT